MLVRGFSIILLFVLFNTLLASYYTFLSEESKALVLSDKEELQETKNCGEKESSKEKEVNEKEYKSYYSDYVGFTLFHIKNDLFKHFYIVLFLSKGHLTINHYPPENYFC